MRATSLGASVPNCSASCAATDRCRRGCAHGATSANPPRGRAAPSVPAGLVDVEPPNRHSRAGFAQSKRSISLAENHSKTPTKTMRLAAKVTGSLPAQWAIKELITIVGFNRQHEILPYLSASQAPRNRPPPRRRRAAGARGARLWANDIKLVSPPHQLPQARLVERHRQGGGARHRGADAVAVKRDAQRRLFRAARPDRSDRAHKPSSRVRSRSRSPGSTRSARHSIASRGSPAMTAPTSMSRCRPMSMST